MLLLNIFVYFLSLTFANEALRDYQFVNELFEAATHDMSKNQEIIEIHFKKEIEDLSLLRSFIELSKESLIKRSQDANSFDKMFREIEHRSDYRCNVTARVCRR